jgi:hypothetical protein
MNRSVDGRNPPALHSADGLCPSGLSGAATADGLRRCQAEEDGGSPERKAGSSIQRKKLDRMRQKLKKVWHCIPYGAHSPAAQSVRTRASTHARCAHSLTHSCSLTGSASDRLALLIASRSIGAALWTDSPLSVSASSLGRSLATVATVPAPYSESAPQRMRAHRIRSAPSERWPVVRDIRTALRQQDERLVSHGG